MDPEEKSVAIKKSITLDSIPEDLAMNIAQEIRSWADEEGSFDEREKARKARDSTLRATALTSKRLLRLYQPSLVKSVTVTLYNFGGFYEMLERDATDLGRRVKSMHFKAPNKESTQAATAEAWTYFVACSDLPFSFDDPNQHVDKDAIEACYNQGSEKIAQKVFNRLKNLETLILEDLTFLFSFQLKIDGKLTQHPFLTSSLRKLYIPRAKSKMFTRLNLSSMNVIWLLIFIPHLKEAAFGVSVTLKCLKILSELSDTFTGLSKIEKLALDIKFDYLETDRRTWWGVAGDSSQNLLGENKKIESVHRLLLVLNTSKLQCLELVHNLWNGSQRHGDETYLTFNCFSSLNKSFRSMRHLRLLGFGNVRNTPSSNGFSCFENLRILSLDYYALFTFFHFHHQLFLPTTIEILCFTFYSGRMVDSRTNVDEEKVLADFIGSNALPNLREVVVPSRQIGADGESIEAHDRKVWTESRRALESHEIFRGGKVKLTKVQPGEKISDASNGEVFMSTARWLSP